jgi:hypothetical protein
MRFFVVLMVLSLACSCGNRRVLTSHDEGDPARMDAAVPVSTGIPMPESFTCAGPPQLEVDGELQPIDHTRNVAYTPYDHEDELWAHLDWYRTERSGWGLGVRLDGVPRNKRIVINGRSDLFDWFHQFSDGKVLRGKFFGAGSATASMKCHITGTLLVEGDDSRPVVEVCLEARSWYGKTTVRYYLRGEVDMKDILGPEDSG